MRLVPQVGEEELRHRAEQADMHLADQPLLHRVDGNAAEAQLVVHVSDIGKPPAKPIEGLAENHLEPATLGILQQSQVLRPKAAGATDGMILVDLRHLPAHGCGKAPAGGGLVAGGLRILALAC